MLEQGLRECFEPVAVGADQLSALLVGSFDQVAHLVVDELPGMTGERCRMRLIAATVPSGSQSRFATTTTLAAASSRRRAWSASRRATSLRAPGREGQPQGQVRPARSRALCHDSDRPHDRTRFRVGTGLRRHPSAAPLRAESAHLVDDRFDPPPTRRAAIALATQDSFSGPISAKGGRCSSCRSWLEAVVPHG